MLTKFDYSISPAGKQHLQSLQREYWSSDYIRPLLESMDTGNLL